MGLREKTGAKQGGAALRPYAGLQNGKILGMKMNEMVEDFCLVDEAGAGHCLRDYLGRVVVVVFWSAECPWSAKADERLVPVMDGYGGRAVLLPVCSNVNETLEDVRKAARERVLGFVLLDDGCRLADAWEAVTTPHAFVIDGGGVLRYRGAVDDRTFRKKVAEVFYVEEAVAALLDGRLPVVQETNGYGCTIVREG